jgi:hypothetical protein
MENVKASELRIGNYQLQNLVFAITGDELELKF